ncbi:MAG: 30S ribosome-binding factor RbfA [Candidatus Omnitrophica bacterium]|jgi:ribosome-binding factor A|nr:30S ribosome-binding factor RbfA [Candidatus Omnitrophota bacterium]
MENEKIFERKKLKFASMIKRMLDEIVRKEISDPRIGFITFTDIKPSSDMKNVSVFVDCFGSPEEQKKSFEALKDARGYIRHILSKKLSMRFVPSIEFLKDENKAQRVEEILKELKKEEKTDERKDI